MVLLKNAKLSRSADNPLKFTLVRPEGATYDMQTAEVALAFKLYSGANESIWECSTAPKTYTNLNGETVQQGTINALKAEGSIVGTTVFPHSATPKDKFNSSSKSIFYSLWLIVDGLRLDIETASVMVTETSEAKI